MKLKKELKYMNKYINVLHQVNYNIYKNPQNNVHQNKPCRVHKIRLKKAYYSN